MKAKNAAEKTDFLADLGAKVREARLRAKLTQRELSQLAEYDEIALSNLELGQSEPRAYNLHRIEKALKLRPGELFDPTPLDAGPQESTEEWRARVDRQLEIAIATAESALARVVVLEGRQAQDGKR